MQMQIGAIITAAGYGTIRCWQRSKLLDPIAGAPIIQRVVSTVMACGRFRPVVVVVNPLFGPAIQATLAAAGFTDLEYVFQPDRLGAADAVHRAIPKLLREHGVDQALVVFGDMPLWQRATLLDLALLHEAGQARISSLMVPYREDHPAADLLRTYWYVTNSEGGSASRVVIKGPANVVEGTLVSPSLYVFHLPTFEELFPCIPATPNADGRSPEFHLPSLIQVAFERGIPAKLVSHNLDFEIVGINNVDALWDIGSFLEARRDLG